MGRTKDITGQSFGRLTAIAPVGRDARHNILWSCSCTCGNSVVAPVVQLIRRRKSRDASCGCARHNTATLPFGEASLNSVYERYKGQARERGLAFEISKEDFRTITQGNCYVCGAPPSFFARNTRPHNGLYKGNGIDRLDNKRGYLFSNCAPCCTTCNRAKGALTLGDFNDWIDRFTNHQLSQRKEVWGVPIAC